MSCPGWKQFELAVSKFFNTSRNPLSGSASKHTASDTLHEHLFIECKNHKSCAMATLYAQVKQSADKEDKLPVIVARKKNTNGFLCVVHSDFLIAFCKLLLREKGYKVSKISK